jgi:hypothetical protein
LHATHELWREPGLALLGAHARQRTTQRVFADDLVHPQKLRAHRICAQPSDVGVAVVASQYRQQPCAQHIALAVGVGTGVTQGASIDPGVVDAGGVQELRKEGQLRIRRGAGTMVPLDVDSTSGGVHHHGLKSLRLNSALAPFGFTHLVTSVNPLKLATSLACRRFVRLQLPEIG